jgi:hypothetical protein
MIKKNIFRITLMFLGVSCFSFFYASLVSAQELAYLVRDIKIYGEEERQTPKQEFLCEIFLEHIDLLEYREGLYISYKTRLEKFPFMMLEKIKRANLGTVQPMEPSFSNLVNHYYAQFADEGLQVVELKLTGKNSSANNSPLTEDLVKYLDQKCHALTLR